MNENSTRMSNTFDPSTRIIRWANAAGSTVAALDLNGVPGVAAALDAVGADSMAGQAMIHGFTQKVGDAAALGIVNGKRPTWQQKGAAMDVVIAGLYVGTWNTKREASSILYQALQRLAQRGSAKAAEYVANWVGMDDDEKARIGKFPTVLREIAEIRAERSEGMDLDDL